MLPSLWGKAIEGVHLNEKPIYLLRNIENLRHDKNIVLR